MRTGFVPVLLICSLVFAYGGKEPGGTEDVYHPPGNWSGSPGEGADVLFIFLAFDDYVPDSAYACGDCYWNPEFEEVGPGWALNFLCGSWAQPGGYPYHWNGGLGSAMDALGYSWEWFPGYTARSGQVIPDVATLCEYQCVFVLTFDAYRSITLTSSTRTTLESYIGNGGHVVLISQDARFSGVPESWLDEWFSCGEINQDVYSGMNPFPVAGLPSSFLLGWGGTALIENFSTGAGGASEGRWWADELSGNGCIANSDYVFASYSEMYGTIFSTFDFEACNSWEVEPLCELIMEMTIGSSLERTTWGGIKAGAW